MIKALTVQERIQGDSLFVINKYTRMVEKSLIDGIINCIIDDLHSVSPDSTYTNNDGIHIANLNQNIINVVCSLYMADSDQLDLIAQDSKLHLRVSNKVHENLRLKTWLTLQSVVNDYRVILDNTLLIMNGPESKLNELIGY